MSLDNWDINPDGTVKARPSLGWSTALMPMGGLLRLEYADSLEDLQALRPTALQLHLSGPQARELGEVLIRMADKIDRQPLGPRQ